MRWVGVFFFALSMGQAWADGSVTFFHQQFLLPAADQVNENSTGIVLGFSDQYKWSAKQRLKTSLEGRFDPGNRSLSERTFFNPKEFYIEQRWQQRQVLQIGFNTFNWGGGDFFKPTDVLNPRQYFDPLNPQKMGVFALAYKQPLLSGSLDLVFIPWQAKPLLPGENSRWLPRDSLQVQGSDGASTLLPPEKSLLYNYGSAHEFNRAQQNNFGIRWSTSLDSFDLAVMGFEGAGAVPVLTPVVSGTPVSFDPLIVVSAEREIGFEISYYRRRLLGWNMAYTMAPYVWRYEGSYWDVVENHPEVPSWPSWNQENVFSVEQTFSLKGYDLIGVWGGTYNRRFSEKNEATLALSHILDRLVFIGLRLSEQTHWSATLALAAEASGAGHLVRGEYTYSFNDFWQSTLTGIYLQGKDRTILGDLDRNQSLQLSLTHLW